MHKTTKLYAKIPEKLVLLLLWPMGIAVRGLANNSPGRFLIGKSFPMVGKAMVYLGQAVDLQEQRTCVDIAGETIKKFFGPDIEIIEDTPACFDYFLHKCPYGLHSPGHLELCHQLMRWDETLIARLGGKMEIIDRMPEGKPVCRMRITNNP